MNVYHRLLRRAVTLAATVSLATPFLSAAADTVLPESIAATLRQRYPDAEIKGVDKEKEKGVEYYEIALRQSDSRFNVEVALDGSIGEVEALIAPKDLEGPMRDRIKELVGDSPQVRIERHERYGQPRNGTFEPLEFPLVVYEVKYMKDGKVREVELDAKTAMLPEEVSKAISRQYGRSTILSSSTDRVDKLNVFVVDLIFSDDRMRLTFAASGELMIEEKMGKRGDKSLVSSSAMRTVGKQEENIEFYKATRRRIYAETVDGEVEKLSSKEEEYDIWVQRKDRVRMYTVDRNGELKGEGEWEELDDDADDDAKVDDD